MVTVHNTHPTERISTTAIRRLVNTLVRRETSSAFEISIVLCDRERHTELHRTFLDRDYPTDVLAFPLGDSETLEGEVYVDLDTARNRHEEFMCSFESEVARYVVHGVLHLLGFDDKTTESRSAMKKKEEKYVSLFEDHDY
ncbi:MAG: rRNA maturation RNase YbeY [Rhodothermales bacterium]|nr:rRNA maturation RNase YbeY [Rhodothermales bacterium]